MISGRNEPRGKWLPCIGQLTTNLQKCKIFNQTRRATSSTARPAIGELWIRWHPTGDEFSTSRRSCERTDPVLTSLRPGLPNEMSMLGWQNLPAAHLGVVEADCRRQGAKGGFEYLTAWGALLSMQSRCKFLQEVADTLDVHLNDGLQLAKNKRTETRTTRPALYR